MADINFDASVLDAPSESAPTTDGDAIAETTIDSPTEGSVDTGSEIVSQPPSRSRSTQQESVDDLPYTERERQLLARIEELSGRQPIAATQQDEQSSFQPQDHNFLDGLDMDEVLSSSDGLNTLLLAVYNKAIQEASRMSAENIMRGLPSTMSSYFNQQLTMRELVTKFYESNSDLAGMKKTVAMVANEVANENPELTAEQVFEETGKRARKLLGVAEIPPKTTAVNGREKPTLHSNRSNGARQRVTVPELDGLAKEIHDLIT
jgi:hypothetical protein